MPQKYLLPDPTHPKEGKAQRGESMGMRFTKDGKPDLDWVRQMHGLRRVMLRGGLSDLPEPPDRPFIPTGEPLSNDLLVSATYDTFTPNPDWVHEIMEKFQTGKPNPTMVGLKGALK